MKFSVPTPWGPAQTARTIADGIVVYSIASHGGIHLSDERLAQMPPLLAAMPPFAGHGWYEEDCDWAIVALAFPDYFSPMQLWRAANTFHRGSTCAAQYLQSDVGRNARERVQRFIEENKAKWTPSSCSSSAIGGWTVHWSRIGDGALAVVHDLTAEEAAGGDPVDIESLYGDRVRLLKPTSFASGTTS